MFTHDKFRKMKEAELRTEVIIPLLRAMGFHDVFEFHGGSGEQGKDIVCWKHGDLRNRVIMLLSSKLALSLEKPSLQEEQRQRLFFR